MQDVLAKMREISQNTGFPLTTAGRLTLWLNINHFDIFSRKKIANGHINFNFNSVQLALVLEDYEPPAQSETLRYTDIDYHYSQTS